MGPFCRLRSVRSWNGGDFAFPRPVSFVVISFVSLVSRAWMECPFFFYFLEHAHYGVH